MMENMIPFELARTIEDGPNWPEELLRRCGLDPTKYRLEGDLDRLAWRIVNRETRP